MVFTLNLHVFRESVADPGHGQLPLPKNLPRHYLWSLTQHTACLHIYKQTPLCGTPTGTSLVTVSYNSPRDRCTHKPIFSAII